MLSMSGTARYWREYEVLHSKLLLIEHTDKMYYFFFLHACYSVSSLGSRHIYNLMSKQLMKILWSLLTKYEGQHELAAETCLNIHFIIHCDHECLKFGRKIFVFHYLYFFNLNLFRIFSNAKLQEVTCFHCQILALLMN